MSQLSHFYKQVHLHPFSDRGGTVLFNETTQMSHVFYPGGKLNQVLSDYSQQIPSADELSCQIVNSPRVYISRTTATGELSKLRDADSRQ